VYAVGFGLSAIILFFSGRTVGNAALVVAKRRVVAESEQQEAPLPLDDERSPRLFHRRLQHASTFAIIAAAGLALQGFVPLASTECERALWTVETARPGCSEAPEIVQGVLHAIVGANAFFMGTFAHGYLWTRALKSPAAPPALRVSWTRHVKLAALGLSMLGGVVGHVLPVRPGSVLLAPSEYHAMQAVEAELEAVGFGQRWAVGWLIVYWASFALDAYVLRLWDRGQPDLKCIHAVFSYDEPHTNALARGKKNIGAYGHRGSRKSPFKK
jgi:hypothetical protein